MAVSYSEYQLESREERSSAPLEIVHSTCGQNVITQIGDRRHDLAFQSRKFGQGQ
jgi:hypothetical protein